MIAARKDGCVPAGCPHEEPYTLGQFHGIRLAFDNDGICRVCGGKACPRCGGEGVELVMGYDGPVAPFGASECHACGGGGLDG